MNQSKQKLNIDELGATEICNYSLRNESCPDGLDCKFIHGLTCPNCLRNVINPFSKHGLLIHTRECEMGKLIQENPNFSRAAESMHCSICYRAVWNTSTRCFGVLSDCWHVFCLSCISEWRRQKHKEGDRRRDCPICREDSTFLLPSPVWPESDTEKLEIEDKYVAALSRVHCKYFNFGRGTCIFQSKCFFRHQDQSKVKI